MTQTIIFLIFVSILVIIFLGFKIFLLFALLGIVIAVYVLCDIIFQLNVKFIKILKKIWNKYLKIEKKFFKFLDKLF